LVFFRTNINLINDLTWAASVIFGYFLSMRISTLGTGMVGGFDSLENHWEDGKWIIVVFQSIRNHLLSCSIQLI